MFSQLCSHVCLPVLAVLPIVVVSTITDVSTGGAGLPVALSLILTWIQMARIGAASAVVTWEREKEKTVLQVLLAGV